MTDILLANTCEEKQPVLVAEQYKVRVCGHTLAGIAGLNLTRGMDVFLL